MNTLLPTQDITQQQVNELLEQIKIQRQQIAEARAALAPIEANLEAAYREYQDKINPLRREISRLQSQINELHERLEGADARTLANLDDDERSAVEDSGEKPRDKKQAGPMVTVNTDPDAIEKDKLLEHVRRVLDTDMNPEDATLLGQLQGLYTDPATTLADLLEKLAWGPVWEQKSPQETLAAQYRRLTAWEQALTRQLAALNRSVEQQHRDRRYGLWQQRQKGPAAWQAFLTQAIGQFQDEIDDLQIQMEALRQQWTQRMQEQ